jgi:hypothetical protein
LQRLLADPAFRHLPDGKVVWDREHDALAASRVTTKPALDGDFSKWQSGKIYRLDQISQLEGGEKLWKGAAQFSARVALRWDEDNLYVGVDVVDTQLYQPFWGREVPKGDVFRLILYTAPSDEIKPDGIIDAYDLYLSPGNFAEVKPSVYCEEDYFPRRARSHNYDQEIRSAWRKTASGFSGDIVLPVTFFERSKFVLGQEVALSFGAQKTFPPSDPFDDDVAQIVFTSKEDKLFPVEPESPATFQRMALVDESNPR